MEMGAFTNIFQRCGRLIFFSIAITCCGASLAQIPAGTPGNTLAAALPDAPQAQAFRPAAQPMTESRLPARRYAQVIEPGQTAYQFTAPEKLVFSLTEVARPLSLLPALYSASYEQLFLTDPKYGRDAGAFGEKFG